jgi:hypothetical protein
MTTNVFFCFVFLLTSCAQGIGMTMMTSNAISLHCHKAYTVMPPQVVAAAEAAETEAATASSLPTTKTPTSF